ncbi:hypothetical protein [Cyanobacterium aponinum]|uniref:Uncharacterized protein n=1 Tax=Cyanobacterium aponinum 0216 TaxID=2676140 RepID=A0A844H1B7_9CHRO|nr:hypothetical protein [Cyanobacterium aponinum]MTF40155.1 hypothetical protein [Cyanobacterium aponinum 0216]
MTKFINLLHDVNSQVQNIDQNYHGDDWFLTKLNEAISIWCNKLPIPEYEKSIVIDDIKKGLPFYQINHLVNYIYEEWEKPKVYARKKNTFIGSQYEEYTKKSKLFDSVKNIFNKLPPIKQNMNIRIIVFIAFIITAVAYVIYLLNKTEEKKPVNKPSNVLPSSKTTSSYGYDSSNYTSVESTQTVRSKLVTNLLILVVSASEKLIVESIKTKGKIDQEDGEKLYEITEFLCQDTETNLSAELANINQFKSTEASEFDIYLIVIELNQAHEEFKKNVNQTDRFYTFRNLAKLTKKVEVFGPLEMEAYEPFNVYKL